MAKERIALWDNLKFVLIFLVVLGHFADFFTAESAVCRSIFLFIYAFHMPLFFFIAGLYHSEKDVGKKVLFYLSGGVALRVTLALFSRAYGNPTPAFPLFHEDGVPWFLYALAAFTLLAYLLRKQNLFYVLVASAVLGCFIGYDSTVGDTLCLSRIIVFAPFYFAGVVAQPDKLLELRRRSRWAIVPAAALVLGWAAACYFRLEPLYALRGLFTGRHPFSEGVAPYGPLVRLGCYALAALLGAALIVLVPAGRLPGITAMGAKSLNVYFWHWPVYMTLEHFFHFKALFGMGTLGKAEFLLIALPVTVALAAVPAFDFPLKLVRWAIYRLPKPKTEEPGNSSLRFSSYCSTPARFMNRISSPRGSPWRWSSFSSLRAIFSRPRFTATKGPSTSAPSAVRTCGSSAISSRASFISFCSGSCFPPRPFCTRTA